MGKLLDKLIATVRKPEAPVADLDAALTEAHREAEAAEAAVAAAEAAYQGALLGPAAALIGLDDARRAAAITRDRARAVVAALEARLTEASHREAENARRQVYDAARQRAAEASAALADTYPLIVAGFRDLLRDLAEAEAAVAEANADLPVGAPPLEGPETCRATPALQREIVSSETVMLWCRAGTAEPVAPEVQAKVLADGSLPRPSTGAFNPVAGAQAGEFERRQFRKVRYRPAVNADHPSRLAISVRLPSFAPTGPAWEPLGWESSPATVLAALAAPVEAPPAGDVREVRETFELVTVTKAAA